MAKKILNRAEVDFNLTWDLNAIYKDENAFNEDYNLILPLAEHIDTKYKGKLNCTEAINQCIDQFVEITKVMTLVGTYASLAVSVDQTNDLNLQRLMRVELLFSQVNSLLSFIENEVSSNTIEVLDEAILSHPENAYYLKDILRLNRIYFILKLKRL